MRNETNDYSKSISRPDERRDFLGHGHLDLVQFEDGISVGRAEFEPGWKWEVDVKPIAGTRTCEAAHSGFCVSGSMDIKMDNGDSFTIRSGDAFHIPPGHTAEVNGSEKCVLIDVGGFTSYAKPKAEAA